MGQSPFGTESSSAQAAANHRRSTRIDYQTPIVLTGRDSGGKPFREETHTLMVSLHGAQVCTNYQFAVGSLLTVENLTTGQAGRAVCVNVGKPSQEEAQHAVSLQLIQPANIWGIENPPPDWTAGPSGLGGSTVPLEPVSEPPISLAAANPFPSMSPAEVTSPVPPEARLTDFEQRVTRLADSVHEKLRMEIDATLRDSLAAYEQRLNALVTEAEARVSSSMERSAAETAAVMEVMRSDSIPRVVQDTLGEFQRRLGELSTEQEGRTSLLIGSAITQAEERLAQMEARSSTHADSLVASLEQRLGGLSTEADSLLAERAQSSLKFLKKGLLTFRTELEDELTASLLASLEHRIDQLMAEVDRRHAEQAQKALKEFEAALILLRTHFEEELSTCRDDAVDAAERSLRSRLAAMVPAPRGQTPGTRGTSEE